MNPLGRRIPQDWNHVEKYPFGTIAPKTVSTVENLITLPYWHWRWDQGSEGACVGFASSMMLTLVNEKQARDAGERGVRRRYDPWWLWDRSKEIDEWPDTNPGDSNGTSVRASCDILRDRGHKVYIKGELQEEKYEHGIAANRWATSVDQMRTSIANDVPVSIGVNWYTNFDSPREKENLEYPTKWRPENWIGEGSLGHIRGGHAVCVYGASDERQAFKIKNSWGKEYPLVWIPYNTMQRLLDEWGEATLITDR